MNHDTIDDLRTTRWWKIACLHLHQNLAIRHHSMFKEVINNSKLNDQNFSWLLWCIYGLGYCKFQSPIACIHDVSVHCSIFSSGCMRSVLSVSIKVSVRVDHIERSIFLKAATKT